MNNIYAMNEKLLGKMNNTLTFTVRTKNLQNRVTKTKAGEKSRVSSISQKI